MPKRAARKGTKKPAAKRKPSARFSVKPDTATQVAVALAGNSSIPLLAAAGVYAAVRKAQGKPVFPGSPVPAVPDVPDVGGALAGFAAADAERDAERDRQFFNFFSRERDRETRERREREAQDRADDLLVKTPVDVEPSTPSKPWMPASVPIFQPYVATRGEPIHAQPGAGNRDTWSNVALDRATPGERPGERPVYRDGRILAPGLGAASGDSGLQIGDEWMAPQTSPFPRAWPSRQTQLGRVGELGLLPVRVGAGLAAGAGTSLVEGLLNVPGAAVEVAGGILRGISNNAAAEDFSDAVNQFGARWHVDFPRPDPNNGGGFFEEGFRIGQEAPGTLFRWFR